jgi:phosphohistidine phosphatase SixA
VSQAVAAAVQPVRLLLVRHGERERDGDELAPLSSGGRWQAEALARWLAVPPFRPEAILCSRSRHSREHGEITSGLMPVPLAVVPVTALTPHTPESEFNWASLRRESASRVDWARSRTILCIGHHPRLQQLAIALTGADPGELQFGELLAIEAGSWNELDAGRGRLGTRHQPEGWAEDDADLAPKIQSKMQTSALLAGFTSTMFGVVLTQSDYWPPEAAADPVWRAHAVTASLTCLGLATLLFVVSIYMYDRLAMPRRYWDAPPEDRRCPQDLWRSFRRDRVRHSLLYAYMVWVWRFVFSAAVTLAMFGFLALVVHRGVWPVTALQVGAAIAVILLYLRFRPELGVD